MKHTYFQKENSWNKISSVSIALLSFQKVKYYSIFRHLIMKSQCFIYIYEGNFVNVPILILAFDLEVKGSKDRIVFPIFL